MKRLFTKLCFPFRFIKYWIIYGNSWQIYLAVNDAKVLRRQVLEEVRTKFKE
jgi:hypothetical protein